MTATLTAMGLELHGDATEVVADYADGSGRYVQYLINDPETDAPGYLLTRYGVADFEAFEALRLESRDGNAPADAIITDRFASSSDDPDVIEHGAEFMVWVDGLAYILRNAEGVLATGSHVDDEAAYVNGLLGGQ